MTSPTQPAPVKTASDTTSALRLPVVSEVLVFISCLILTPLVMWGIRQALYRSAVNSLESDVEGLLQMGGKEPGNDLALLLAPDYGDRASGSERFLRAAYFLDLAKNRREDSPDSREQYAARLQDRQGELKRSANLEFSTIIGAGMNQVPDPMVDLLNRSWCEVPGLPATADQFNSNILAANLPPGELAAQVSEEEELHKSLKELFATFRELPAIKLLRVVTGLIQWWTICVALFAVILVSVRYWTMTRRESSSLKNAILPVLNEALDPKNHLTRCDLEKRSVNWAQQYPPDRSSTASSRFFGEALKWLCDALTHARGTDPRLNTAGVVNRVQAEAETLRREVELGYTPVEYVLWCIPTLGFLGTVEGISNAMQRSDRLLTAAGTEQQTASFQDVTLQLAYAFDTTWLALFLGIFVMLVMRTVRRREEQIIAETERCCLRLCDRVQL